MRDPHVVLGVDADADAEVVKRAFRAKAMTLHPDVAGASACEDKFKELRTAYDVMLKKLGSAPDASADAYGPGMRARMDAARAWRERAGLSSSEPMASARERSEQRNAPKARGAAFDDEAKKTLDELLEERRRAMRANTMSNGFVERAGGRGGMVSGRNRLVVFGAVGFAVAVVFARRVLHIQEEKRRASEAA